MAYCDRCDRWLSSDYGLEQHKRDSYAHWICYVCDIDFRTESAREQHYIQSRCHSYCRHCKEFFDDDDELEEHMEDSHFYCRKCRKDFTNEYGLQEHYRQSPAHNYCVSCRRDFQSDSNLKAHLNSSIHQPKDVDCPFKGCGRSFVSRSALILHLEGGKCRSGIDRATVDHYVQQYDKNNVITDPSRLLTNGNNNSNIKYIATERSWNSCIRAYECYLCHNTFQSLQFLNQHLASPRHQDKIYICPLSSCRARFTTLSGLCQHIESERCGVAKFKVVQNTMDSLMGNMKRLTL